MEQLLPLMMGLKTPLTFEFDNDNNVVASTISPYVVGEYSNKKDDLEIASDSTYTFSQSLNFVVEIDRLEV